MQKTFLVFCRLRIGAIYHEKNFLITGINNNRIEQDLGSTKDAIEYPNQTVTAFFLVNAILDCHDGLVDLLILVIFLLWRFSIQVDSNIF